MVIRSGIFRGVNPYSSLISAGVILLFIFLVLAFPTNSASWIDSARTIVTFYFNWWYVIMSGSFLVFLIAIAVSKYGAIRLGDADERPKYSYFTWFAMLYAAGQGIGIIFWSIAEPIFHYSGGTPFAEGTGTAEAADMALQVSFFHWGLNAWAIYCIVALALCLVSYRLNKPLGIRYTLYPLFGDHVEGKLGVVIDVIAVFATIFGIATSLGLGVTQINAGLNHIWGIPITKGVQLVLIAAITGVALCSVLSGLDRGIKWLSQVNMWLTIVLLVFFFAWGPTRYLLVSLGEATVSYLMNLFKFNVYIEGVPNEATRWSDMWQGWWTTFYWGWWISWAPFVGVFVARVSRGRTVREFIFGVVGVSSLLSFVWIVAYGGTALWAELFGPGGVSDAVSSNVSMALFATFEAMDVGVIGVVAGVLGTILVTTYFVTSSDSGTLVVATILSEGNEHPMYRHRLIWGSFEGVVAAVLLVAGGSAALSTLQTAAIIAALPFSIIMVLMCVAIVRCLSQEHSSSDASDVS
ncbi:BCCT family transporter [Meridianimarinicoccus sp. MJW13]|uniref:BCCT family transporter n=1 Tax=Meridianimarinicoccus sp. MJW13 TaxID=2720031 RepID=UPI001867A54F|nr:BCCT family transporter [Fluviibacterium sp. MJW13]